eukprot:3757990-Prymnesium_polylepis.1
MEAGRPPPLKICSSCGEPIVWEVQTGQGRRIGRRRRRPGGRRRQMGRQRWRQRGRQGRKQGWSQGRKE